ncbi:DUF1349 domain-containing protein [Actinoplanes bogorensis]|uniref:DUF1349 domain-containing protein n=1 Tax=Paractinoplanes bogorensis TaxID=1610840 RepID=A0ABS5YM94_9ACTN|nr:ABC transporter permease subunit [Actinoplanes bogorensis]MBU2664572.1 DUF1349 domain-containing protein [Actinoplanes bogorensis]
MIRAEFTKFRSVRGWVLGLATAVALFVGMGWLTAAGSFTSCDDQACPSPPVGPEGQAVEDHFGFAHRTLTGDGSLTARVRDFSGIITYPPPNHDEIVDGLVPWAKAGLIVKSDINPGSPYAAIMLTADHGVRFQHNYVHDAAGPVDARWLRISRSGADVTAYASADGRNWTTVGTMSGWSGPVRIGFAIASPPDITAKGNPMGGSIVQARFTQASAVFDQITSTAGGAWRYDEVGADGLRTDWEKLHRAPGMTTGSDTLTLTGSGDIAPATDMRVAPYLAGALPALLAILVVAVLFITSEFRRGLIRTTLLASPHRARMLAAKAAVIGGVTFAAALIAVVVARPLVSHVFRANGNFAAPTGLLTDLRLSLGTAALLAATAVCAYALGALLRRGLLAIVLAVALTVVPYLLATASVLPVAAGEWLLRLTPAAGFAVQQAFPAYEQVFHPYTPADGYFPLAPAAGLAVTCLWAAGLLTLATVRLNRADI